MLQNYQDAERCRMAIVCFALSQFITAERGKHTLAEINTRYFHESFRRMLLMLADQRINAGALFHWEAHRREWREVREILQKLAENGAMEPWSDGVYTFRLESCRRVFEGHWKMGAEGLTEVEHTKLMNAAMYAKIAYYTRSILEESLAQVGLRATQIRV